MAHSRKWSCVGCCTEFTGALDPRAPVETIQNVRPLDPLSPVSTPTPIRVSLDRLVDGLAGENKYQGPERRGARRYPVMIRAALTPVDGALIPLTDSCAAVTKNLSTTGVCFFSLRAVTGGFIVLDVNAGREVWRGTVEKRGAQG